MISGCINDPLKYQNNVVEIQAKQGTYKTINEALENASNGDTIIIYPGYYKESLVINKSITLLGEDKDNTIIDGNSEGDVVCINVNYVNINGLTITNASHNKSNAGINIRSTNNSILNCNIINNNIYAIFISNNAKNNSIKNNYISNNGWSIYLTYSSNNNISYNYISNNSEYGMYLGSQSNYNEIFGNIFSDNDYAIRIKGSNGNILIKNTFSNNVRGIYLCCGSRSNKIHHCNFFNNSQYNANDYLSNYWDNGSHGNYWDDYTGMDENADGIGDKPYKIGNAEKGTVFDNFPLMDPV
jgi:parallel beta-helix repeat protein